MKKEYSLNGFVSKLYGDFGYRLPLSALFKKIDTEELLPERFGGSEELSDEDAKWVKDIEMLVRVIRGIVSKPHIHLKREEALKNINSFYRIDARVVRETCRDSKLWRQGADGSMQPEYIRTFEYEEDVAIYENRFVAMVIDRLISVIGHRLNRIFAEAGQLDRLLGSREYGVGDVAMLADFDPFFRIVSTAPEDKDFSGSASVVRDRVPALSTPKSSFLRAIEALSLARKRMIQLRRTAFYRDCMKKGKLAVAAVKPTNILIHDRKYNYVYRFFLAHLLKTRRAKDEVATQLEFANYATVKLLYELHRAGFMPKSPELALVHNEGLYESVDIVMTKGPLDVSFRSDAALGMRVTVSLDYTLGGFAKEQHLAEKRSARYYLRYMGIRPRQLRTVKEVDEDIDAFSKAMREEGYHDAFTLTMMEKQHNRRAIITSHKLLKLDANVWNMLKTMFFFTEASSEIYSRKCPVCGGANIDNENGNCLCIDCMSAYALLGFGKGRDRRELIWLKRVAYEVPQDIEEKEDFYDDLPEIDDALARELLSRAEAAPLDEAPLYEEELAFEREEVSPDIEE